MELLNQIFWLCIIPLFGLLCGTAISFMKTKKKELTQKIDNDVFVKYLDMADKTITECVIATNQTYVEALKGQNAFDAEAQKKAFAKTYNAVLAILSEDAKEYLTNAFGDLTLYLTAKIETAVSTNK